MNQPVAMDESVGVVKLLTGSGEVVEEGHTVAIHEVRAHAIMSIYITTLCIFLGAEYPSQKLTDCRWEPHSSFSVNVISVAALSRTYRQTFSAFNTFVCGITNVCLLD